MVQLVQRQYEARQVPRGERPVWEFDLMEHEEIVGIFHSWTRDFENRATVDHFVIAWVAVRL